MNSVSTRIGVIGGGQLARMMAAPAISLGLHLKLLAEGPQVSAAQVIPDTVVGDYTDEQTLRDFVRDVDVVTFDHEHVPTRLLGMLESEGTLVCPGPDALQYAQDKLAMRRRLTVSLDAPAPVWRRCADADELRAFGDEIGWPIIAKATRGGYDGHGVWRLGRSQAETPFVDLPDVSAGERVSIVGEELIDFSRELSVLVCRSASGQIVSYPVSETIQRGGVCAQTITPAPGLDAKRASEVTQLARTIATELGVVGLLAVELMERRSGEIVINELAMRPHNTAHWTIDGAVTSQFENHLRAIAGLPLGATDTRAPWIVMTNVLGGSVADLTAALPEVMTDEARLRIELYGKSVTPGRKVGHVNAYGDDLAAVLAASQDAAQRLMGESHG